MNKKKKVKYLIIGNSAGGIGAVEAIREVDQIGVITIVSDEPYPAYSRPMISDYLADKCPIEKMLFRSPDFYEKNQVQTVLGQKVIELDPDQHIVKLDNGSTIGWEKLLLATGGTPFIPKMEGISEQGFFTFTTLDDAKAIDEFLKKYPEQKIRAVVIGGGLIGASVTEALLERGVEVTIVEMMDRILSTILDEAVSAIEAASLEKSGVKIITGNTVNKVDSTATGEPSSVTLDDGQTIPCEMLIVAIGVRPRTELVMNTTVKVNRGILVDRHMATSVPDIYACGDVAEAYDFIHEENRVIPVWPNAYIGGRVAGFNMAGTPAEYAGGTAMNSMKYFGISAVSAGITTPPDNSYEVLKEQHDDIYRKVVLKDGQITGLIFVTDIEKSGIIYNLMKDRVNVDAFKQVLVSDDFGFVYLPEEIGRARLAAPSSASASPIETEEPSEEEAIIGE